MAVGNLNWQTARISYGLGYARISYGLGYARISYGLAFAHEQDIENVFLVLAVILHLGNVEFGLNDNECAAIPNMDSVQTGAPPFPPPPPSPNPTPPPAPNSNVSISIHISDTSNTVILIMTDSLA